jgi:hypothetical protein
MASEVIGTHREMLSQEEVFICCIRGMVAVAFMQTKEEEDSFRAVVMYRVDGGIMP